MISLTFTIDKVDVIFSNQLSKKDENINL